MLMSADVRMLDSRVTQYITTSRLCSKRTTLQLGTQLIYDGCTIQQLEITHLMKRAFTQRYVSVHMHYCFYSGIAEDGYL